MKISRTAIGIRGKDGIVFGVEKIVQSKLYEQGANKRIFHVDHHIGMVYIFLPSGLIMPLQNNGINMFDLKITKDLEKN